MKKIKKEEALGLIENFKKTMKEFGRDNPKKGYTQSVGFNRHELEKWLKELGPDTEEIRIFFAEYSKKNKSLKENTDGRFTAVLWPYNSEGEPANNEGGEEEPPVNYGELEP